MKAGGEEEKQNFPEEHYSTDCYRKHYIKGVSSNVETNALKREDKQDDF